MTTPSTKEFWANNHGPKRVTIFPETQGNGPDAYTLLRVSFGKARWTMPMEKVTSNRGRGITYWRIKWSSIPSNLQKLLLKRSAIEPKGNRTKPGEGSYVYAHRLVAALCLEESIAGMQIDHYNEDGLDNRVENLIPRTYPGHIVRHTCLNSVYVAYDNIGILRKQASEDPDWQDDGVLTEEPPEWIPGELAAVRQRLLQMDDEQRQAGQETLFAAAEFAMMEYTKPTPELIRSCMALAALVVCLGHDVFEVARQLREMTDYGDEQQPEADDAPSEPTPFSLKRFLDENERKAG